uniref:(California timema) hypothetical protein n=1 Tax=Timema californicum TaxID=61474 RepID=A0A7R9P4Y9_TIMCA|nr:unnamed protein product [Timema californicum]
MPTHQKIPTLKTSKSSLVEHSHFNLKAVSLLYTLSVTYAYFIYETCVLSWDIVTVFCGSTHSGSLGVAWSSMLRWCYLAVPQVIILAIGVGLSGSMLCDVYLRVTSLKAIGELPSYYMATALASPSSQLFETQEYEYLVTFDKRLITLRGQPQVFKVVQTTPSKPISATSINSTAKIFKAPSQDADAAVLLHVEASLRLSNFDLAQRSAFTIVDTNIKKGARLGGVARYFRVEIDFKV